MSEWAFDWLSREELVALGWTLLHFCWQGAAIAMLFAIVDRFSSRATPAVRYAVALAALALMPLAVVTTFANEMQAIAPARAIGAFSGQTEKLIGVAPHDAIARLSSLSVEPTENRRRWLTVNAERVLPWVDAIWAMGMLVLAVRALGGWWQLEQLRRRARGMIPADVQSAFHRIAEQLGVGRRVVLRLSDEVISPLAMGVWQATVILPLGSMLHLSGEELEAVLAHELGHIRRWDYVCNLLQTAVEGVLFFHPAVWWVSKAVRDRREVCCDEIAVQSCADALVYARALLRLEEQRATEVRLAVALNGCSGSLLGRVRQVLGEGEPMESRMTSGVRVAVAGAVVIGLLLGPKVSDAVATPILAVSRPIVAHVASVLPKTTASTDKSKIQRTGADSLAMQTNRTSDVQSARTDQRPAVASETASLNPGADGLMYSMSGQDDEKSSSDAKTTSKGVSYLDGMRAAGYPLDLNNDLNTLVSMKSLGVTPEYAKAMGTLGFGKPTVEELISMKALGVTPEYVAELKRSGIAPKSFHEAVTEKALGITAEYATAMKQSGFGELDVEALVSLKAQGVTPEYTKWLKSEFPNMTMDELRQAAVFHLDEKFVARAKSHGFDGKNMDKLLKLKMSGLLDE